jgi:hypothetical protein
LEKSPTSSFAMTITVPFGVFVPGSESLPLLDG